MATGYTRLTVTDVTAVGTIQSTHQYDVTAKFEIAISPYGRNETGGAKYSITIDGANSGSRSCTFNSSGGYVTLGSYTKRVTMDKSGQAKTINISAALSTGISPSSISGSTTYVLPAVTWQWTVSYNANGGSGAPASQTKTYGSNLTLSSTKPTRTGYTFLGWSTDKNATTATYQPGGLYTSNSGATLYAVWKINTYTVSYDANGGSGAPDSQTKTYGATLTLSKTKPTRTNYNFKGWSKDKSATSPTYSAGGVYTEDAAVTLYAVWELAYWAPKITDVFVHRCTNTGVNDEEGLYAKVDFKWECCQILGANNVKSITVDSKTVSVSGTTGSVSAVVGGNYSIDEYYRIPIVVVDSKNGTSTYDTYIESYSFTIDFKAGGKGVAFGMPAKEDGFHVNFPSHFYEAIKCYAGIQSEEGAISGHSIIGDDIYSYGDITANGNLTYTQKILWSGIWHGGWAQTAGEAIFSESVLIQHSGIVLIFQEYDPSTQKVSGTNINSFFVSKKQIELVGGNGFNFTFAQWFGSQFVSKYLYINDTKIIGNVDNANGSWTRNGVTFCNNKTVLTKVIGV